MRHSSISRIVLSPLCGGSRIQSGCGQLMLAAATNFDVRFQVCSSKVTCHFMSSLSRRCAIGGRGTICQLSRGFRA